MFGRELTARDLIFAPARCLSSAARANCRPSTAIARLAQMVSQLDELLVESGLTMDARPIAGYGGIRSERAAVVDWSKFLFDKAERLLHDQLLPALRDEGVRIAVVRDLSAEEQAWLGHYFRRQVYPLLTPLAVDPGRPFPFISSASLNLLVELRKPEVTRVESPFWVARVKVPRSMPRLIRVPCTEPGRAERRRAAQNGLAVGTYVWSVDLVRHFVGELFSGIPVRRACFFHVLRADGNGDEADAPGEGRARRHDYQPVARLDVEVSMPEALLTWLSEHLEAPSWTVVRQEYPLEMLGLLQLAAHIGRRLEARELKGF